jgi:hypothetical protein
MRGFFIPLKFRKFMFTSMRSLLYILVLIAFFQSKGQVGSIKKNILLPKSNSLDSRDVIETVPNNYVMVGFTNDTLNSQLHQRLTLIGLDQNVNVMWRKSYGNNTFNYTPYIWSAGMIHKKNNNLYSAMNVTDSNSIQAGVLLKFNFNGDTIWQKKFYKGAAKQVFFNSVTSSIDNGLLITGAIQTNTPTYNNHPTVGLYLLKTDMNGNTLWEKTIYKPNLDETLGGYKLIQDSITKRIFVVGTQDIGVNISSDLLVFDSLGNKISEHNYNGPNGGALIDIIKTKDGNLAAVGGNNYPQQIATMSTCRSLLIKVDTAGNLLFRQEYDTTVVVNCFNNIVELKNGDFIISGELETLLQHNLGLNDLVRVIRTDANGNMIWKKYFDHYTDNHNQDACEGLNLTSTGQIIFTSACYSGEPAPRGYVFYMTDTSYCDINAIGCSNFAGINELNDFRAGIHVEPNPAVYYCTLTCDLQIGNEPLSVSIANSIGQNVYFDHLCSSFSSKKIDLSNFENGMYFISVYDSKHSSNQKLIILK